MVSVETSSNVSPNLIILPDGRHIPTFRNLQHKESSKSRIKEALSSKGRKPEDYVKSQSPEWQKEKLLFLRGLSIGEVASMMDKTNDQIRRDLYRKRPTGNSLPADFFKTIYGGENQTERRRKAAKPGQPKRIADRPPPSEDEAKSIQFAKLMLERGFIEKDISGWEELHAIFKQRGIELPHEFSDKLSLEVFLKAIRKKDEGDKTLLDDYTKIGVEEFGSEWFDRLNKERRVIRDAVTGRHLNGNGRNGHSVDGQTIWRAFRELKGMGVQVEES